MLLSFSTMQLFIEEAMLDQVITDCFTEHTTRFNTDSIEDNDYDYERKP